MRIAILENDTRTALLLEEWLQSAGHTVHLFQASTSFSEELDRARFDAAVLGSLPGDLSAADILQTLRERAAGVPVLRVLHAGGEQDIVEALSSGADDCMSPMRRHELRARLEALARRPFHAQKSDGEQLNFGSLIVDLKNRLILRDGARVMLTPKTYDLAVLLMLNRGQLLRRGYLLEQVWGREKSAATRTLDTHISRLRTVLGLTPDQGWQLQSVYQHGYRLDRIETAGDSSAPALVPQACEAAMA